MSVKIYSGLRSTTHKDVLERAREIRDVLEPMFFDAFSRTAPGLSWSQVSDHWQKVDDLSRSRIRSLDAADIGYSVVMLPHQLVLVFSEYESYREALLASGTVTEFGYWDNTDAPEGMDDDEWSSRRALWSSALGNFDKAPSEVGLLFEHPGRLTTIHHFLTDEGRKS